MDKAFWDSMRWDMFRWDVYRPDWDRLLAQYKNVSAKAEMVVDSGVAEVVADDADKFFRVDVFVSLFDELKNRLEKV